MVLLSWSLKTSVASSLAEVDGHHDQVYRVGRNPMVDTNGKSLN